MDNLRLHQWPRMIEVHELNECTDLMAALVQMVKQFLILLFDTNSSVGWKVSGLCWESLRLLHPAMPQPFAVSLNIFR